MSQTPTVAERVRDAIHRYSDGRIRPSVDIVERCWPVLVYLYKTKYARPNAPDLDDSHLDESGVTLACKERLIEPCRTGRTLMRGRGLYKGTPQLWESWALADAVRQAMTTCEPKRGYPQALPFSIRVRDRQAGKQVPKGPPHEFRLAGPPRKLSELCKAVFLHDEDLQLQLERYPDEVADGHNENESLKKAVVRWLSENTGETTEEITAFVDRAGSGCVWGPQTLPSGEVLPDISQIARRLIDKQAELLEEIVPFIQNAYPQEAEVMGLVAGAPRGGATIVAETDAPPDGYVSVSHIMGSAEFRRDVGEGEPRNPARTTIQGWYERTPAERWQHPVTHEVHYPRADAVKRTDEWARRVRASNTKSRNETRST